MAKTLLANKVKKLMKDLDQVHRDLVDLKGSDAITDVDVHVPPVSSMWGHVKTVLEMIKQYNIRGHDTLAENGIPVNDWEAEFNGVKPILRD
jgi:hypothetical protein